MSFEDIYKFIKKYIILALFLALFFISAELVRSPKSDSAQIYFLDVGQGDAELIQKGDYQILIDGGPDDKVLSEIGKVMPASDRKIETIILSHPHADHLAGLNLILERYEVGKIYGSGVLDTTNGYLEFLSKIRDQKIDFIVPDLTTKITPFSDGQLIFIWPGEKYKSTNISNLNNSSEVVKFCYFANCALFTGDIEKDEQSNMLDYYQAKNQTTLFRSDIYKVPHHGSSNGIYQNLIETMSPTYSVIEVGVDNKYGHPHPTTLELFKNLKIPVFRTDQDGTIKFQLDQNGISKD